MALSPIAFISPNFRDFKNYWLKAYEPGTTTPKTMALDSAGVVTVAKLELNKDGFLESAGGALVIPYIDGAYDLWLFPTEAEADANDTVNAERLADNITPSPIIDGIGSMTIQEAIDSLAIGDGDLLIISDRDSAFFDVVLASTVTPNTYNIVQCVGIPTLALVRREVEDVTSFDSVTALTDNSNSPAFFDGQLVSTGGTQWKLTTISSQSDLTISNTSPQLYANRQNPVSVRDFEDLITKADVNDPTTWNWAAAMQAAALLAGDIAFPKNHYFVKPENATMRALSNTHIDLCGSIIECTASNLDGYRIFYFEDVINVSISNGDIKGDRGVHTGVTGESATLVNFRGVSNGAMTNMRLRDSWGDGWFIGSTATQEYCENMVLNNVVAVNNRRNNASIISVRGLIGNGLGFHDANGTNPQSGLDIEPNEPTEFLQGIILNGVSSSGNLAAGIEIMLNALSGSVNPISITINEHTDDSSEYGALVRLSDFALEGFVNINNSIHNSQVKNAITIRNWSKDGPKITIDGHHSIVNHTRTGDEAADTPIAISSVGAVEVIGNVEIRNQTVSYTSGQSGTGFAVSMNASSQKVIIDNPQIGIFGWHRMSADCDVTNLPIKSFGGNATFPFNLDPAPKTRITNRVGEGQQTVTLETPLSNNIRFQLINTQPNANDRIVIVAPAGETIFPDSLTTAGGEIKLLLQGESVWLNRYEGDWYIEELSVFNS